MTTRRLLVPAAAAVVAVIAWDRLRGDRGLLFEAPPDWSATHLLRSAVLAVAGAALVLAGRRAATSWSSRPVDREFDDGGRWSWAAAVAANVVALAAAVLVVVDPERLTRLVREDGVVEWVSAVLAFAAAILFAAGAFRLRRSTNGVRRSAIAVLVALAGLSLLIGLEEVSWFQRVSGLESPAALRNRNQPEFNLHNGATDLSENLYYVGGFVITVLAPGLLAGRRPPGRFAPLDVVVPPRAVLYTTGVASAVVYEMWNIAIIQLTFFATVALVATEPSLRRRSTVLVILLLVVAGLFLGFGDSMIRSWDDTEIRELLLPFGLAVYGFGVVRRISALSNSRYRPLSHSDGGRSRRSSAQVTMR